MSLLVRAVLQLSRLPWWLGGGWFLSFYLRRYVVPELVQVYGGTSIDWMFEPAEKRAAPMLKPLPEKRKP